MTEEDRQHLVVMMTELVTKMEVLLDKQDELAENISQIKEAVYHPDQGLYARLRELDVRLGALELWKNLNARILWVIGGSLGGLLIKTTWEAIF